jgi:hypothetical protein
VVTQVYFGETGRPFRLMPNAELAVRFRPSYTTQPPIRAIASAFSEHGVAVGWVSGVLRRRSAAQ